MLYDGNNPVLRIVGVERVCWDSEKVKVNGRAYSSLSFRVRGRAEIIGGSKQYKVDTNDIMYLPQNTDYTAQYTDTELIAIHFVTAQKDGDIEVYSFQNGEQIYKLFLQAHTLWKNKEVGYEVYTMSLLYSILGTLLENDSKINLPHRFLDAVSYINADYQRNDVSVDMICAKAGIGATTFRQLFKKYYQKTPMEYVTDLRLECARNLISNGMPVESAAYESGFNDPKYFARIVKKRLGCTPRAFKTYGK